MRTARATKKRCRKIAASTESCRAYSASAAGSLGGMRNAGGVMRTWRRKGRSARTIASARYTNGVTRRMTSAWAYGASTSASAPR